MVILSPYFFVICGQIIPTKPIIPRNDTHTATITELRSSDMNLNNSTFTPTLLAATSPLSSALYLHDSIINTKKSCCHDNKHNQICLISSSPKITKIPYNSCRQTYICCIKLKYRCGSSPTEPIAIPASTTTPGSNERILHNPSITSTESTENMKAISDAAYGLIPDV